MREKWVNLDYGDKEAVLEALEKEFRGNDTECCHLRADEILCGLLEKLGYGDVVRAYEKIEKWYA